MLEISEKRGRKKMGRPLLIDTSRSPVDFHRICQELGFGDIPPNLTEPSLIDLWNNMTDYYLPRLDGKLSPLSTLSKPLKDRTAEVELWRKALTP
jgi:hypothetical protein